MNERVFNRETLLDVSVNFIPLAIISGFIALFVGIAPWGFHPVMTTLQLSLLIVPAVILLVLTYYAADAVERDEADG